MGLAARFTLGLGLVAIAVAGAATFLLLQGLDVLQSDLVEEAHRGMADETAWMEAQGATPPSGIGVLESVGPRGNRVQAGDATVNTAQGAVPTRVFSVPASGPAGSSPTTLYAPQNLGQKASQRVLLLVVLVTGGLALATVIVGAWMARRIAAPLNEMVEDVLAISRGRLDRSIRGDDAVGEVARLATAMDRMVADLVEGQETERALVASQAEAESLRVLRRNLRPMKVAVPPGWNLSTRLVEAGGAGSGDFSDALRDEKGRLTLVVGAPAAEGMPGALLMAMTRAYLRGAVLAGAEPAAACDTANTALNRDLSRGLYCAAMILQAEPASGRALLVSTGHQTPAIRFDAAAGQWKKLQPNGIALGFDEGPVFRKALETLQIELLPGDAIFLASPAVVRATARSGKELGEGGLAQLAKIAVESGLEAMEQKLRAFLGEAPQSDMAFALLQRTP
jgi:serine phosphatase RsbU (regulator of sigma subunit)